MIKRIKKNKNISYVILIIGIITSIYLSWNTYKNQLERETIQFNLETKQIKLLIQTRMDAYKQVLLGGVGLFAASDNVTREMWTTYVNIQKIQKTFPGIQGLGYSQVVKPEDKESHIETLRINGFPSYTIKPLGIRNIYTSIIYLEPFDNRNKRAFGYDMYSNSIRHKAMDKAIDSTKASMSGKVRLLQENNVDEQSGFLLYLPIYKKGSSLTTREERFSSIEGFVYAAFRMKDLMLGVTDNKFNNINFKIFDGNIMDNNSLMFDSSINNKNLNARFSSQREFIFAGHIWNMQFNDRSSYGNEYDYTKHWFVLIIGFILSFSIFGIILLVERDVESKFQNSSKLADLALRIQLALKAGKIGIWEWDFHANTLLWDDRMYEIYGILSSDTQKPFVMWTNAIDEEDKTSVDKSLRTAVNENKEYNQKFWIKMPTGEKRYVHSIGLCQYDTNNKPIRMIGVNTDITEQKIQEEELNSLVLNETLKRIKQEKMMIQQSKLASMGEMIGSIAHQWRQPLGAIGGILINIEESYEYNELSQEYLSKQIDSAEKNLSYMSKTIDDFRNFFEPTKNKMDFCIQKATMNGISIVNAQMYDNEIKIRLYVNDSRDTKEITEFNNTHHLEHNFIVNGYPNEFIQVLTNLFANAKDAIFKNIDDKILKQDNGLILVNITVENDNIIISVQDNAGGIPLSIMDRVFEPYFTTKEQGKGTGIGLYMSKMIIEENMNGHLSVSNKDNGAEFKIELKRVINA